MAVRVALEDAAQLSEVLDDLLPVAPDLTYANFAPLAERRAALHALHRNRLCAADDALGWLVARDADGRPLACARLARRRFDSAHFGLAMAAIERPPAIADAPRRGDALRALFATAFEELRARRVAHVAVRVAADDPPAAIALQYLGARHVGTHVHWVCALDARPAPPPPAGIALEALDADGLRALAAPTSKRLVEWSGRAYRNGPFSFDDSVPAARADALYPEWMKRVFSGEWADGAMIARDAGEVVAVIPMQLVRDVSEAADARVFGRSLAATLPDYRGLCTALMREMIARRPFGADWMEGDTPVTTYGTINMFAKVGFRYLRATSVFHRRLDQP